MRQTLKKAEIIHLATRSRIMSSRKRRISPVLFAAAVVVIAGCSDSSGDETHGVTATQLCDAVLSESAAASLERMTGTTEFTELDGTDEAGQPNKFSLSRAAKNLHAIVSKRSSCSIYKADDESGRPVVDINFAATVSHPKTSKDGKDRVRNRVTYRMGQYATAGADGASLFFHCPTKGDADDYVGDAEYVKAAMYAPVAGLKGNHIDDDRMTVLTAVSRKLVAKLGCENTADLPAKIPDPA
ncbi:hypothetical protein AB0C93_29080 [Streptomyces sp. NPDC048518]|uniref:hypothetical protein n=1 Tax=Streptomyces sp. NPDC048518 TaxID=3155029 RepID=UPI0033D14B9D